MINTAAKWYYAAAVLAAVAVVGYEETVHDRAGWVLMFFLLGATLLSGLAAGGSGFTDRARWVADDAPLEHVTLGPASAPAASPWPALASIAVGLLALGLVFGTPLVVAGVAVSLLAAGGWLGQTWHESPRWNPARRARLSDRVLAPFGIPLFAFVVVVIFVGGVSRVLLAVNEKASVAVALVAAIIVLGLFALIALRPHVSTRVLGGLVGIGAVVLISAGAAGAAKGERTFENKNESTKPELKLVAKNTNFDKNQLTVRAGQDYTLTFTNGDAGIYHNVGIYTAATNGAPVQDFRPIKGVSKAIYDGTAPKTPGTYTFKCDFHANMVGTLTVQP